MYPVRPWRRMTPVFSEPHSRSQPDAYPSQTGQLSMSYNTTRIRLSRSCFDRIQQPIRKTSHCVEMVRTSATGLNPRRREQTSRPIFEVIHCGDVDHPPIAFRLHQDQVVAEKAIQPDLVKPSQTKIARKGQCRQTQIEGSTLVPGRAPRSNRGPARRAPRFQRSHRGP